MTVRSFQPYGEATSPESMPAFRNGFVLGDGIGVAGTNQPPFYDRMVGLAQACICGIAAGLAVVYRFTGFRLRDELM